MERSLTDTGKTEEGAYWGRIRSSLLDLWVDRSSKLPREASRRPTVRHLKVQGSAPDQREKSGSGWS